MKLLIKTTCYLLILTFHFGCKKNTPKENYDKNTTACGVKDPIQNLPWLNAEFKLLAGGPTVNGIILYKYEGNEVIEIQNSLFSSTNQHQYLCDGTKLNIGETPAFTKFKEERKLIVVLYGTNIWK
ncbi:hypothetical protein CPT03_04215 [Pedobacter ginsengisoli]|uniref:Uncharacterized protein n=1 Tax=Pedobacter ginsengisoli TaxID=363852 RepID=A0A2D1U293_9SPHI|nr:hypothetical protein [Pedobacter ginsengisoli]ATP55725.1 hypothetical protein CPT03_04215 [Pedobacter ginsengisoli]